MVIYLVKKSSLCSKEKATQVNITYVGKIYTLLTAKGRDYCYARLKGKELFLEGRSFYLFAFSSGGAVGMLVLFFLCWDSSNHR